MKTLHWSIVWGGCALILLLPPTLFHFEKQRLNNLPKLVDDTMPPHTGRWFKDTGTGIVERVWSAEKTNAETGVISDKRTNQTVTVLTNHDVHGWVEIGTNDWYSTNEEHELVLPKGQFINYRNAVICRITNDADWALLTKHFTNEMPDSQRMTFLWYEPKKP